DDRIYLAGGYGSNMIGTEAEVYDPATDTWTLLPPMRFPRNHCAGGFIGRKFYVVAGREGGPEASGSALEAYDPDARAWTTLAGLPTARSGVGAGVVNGRLFVFGGEGALGPFDEVDVYDPAADAWSRLAPMPRPRHGIFG